MRGKAASVQLLSKACCVAVGPMGFHNFFLMHFRSAYLSHASLVGKDVAVRNIWYLTSIVQHFACKATFVLGNMRTKVVYVVEVN